ncbi:Aldehyde/histidinol dehydrogenase [Thelonectria olida]|uniref:Aldehyde/histidinol dehydrogenase n=1 Tax=Thelonectria olida TaxID=1576542 RepID=A0A9P8W7G3_9HYPO|nr:Aldehyde/histidinol dehydrogenase [Thelonectria olida]
MDAAAIERLQDTVTDGRPESLRFRQNQLHALHLALRTNAADICAAMAKDTGFSAAEVDAEFYLAMEAVAHFYDGIDFQKALEDEYAVVAAKDHAGRRLGAGLVVLRPTSHTRFFSVVSPLAAALAAACCVALELQDSLLNLDALLRKILPNALDPNVFCITSTITDAAILSSSTLVDQTSSASSSLTTQLLSSSSHRAVAVVDRTADLDAAARAITAARFSFGGMSPYAPDLVLVNEYVKKDFFEACSRYATLTFARETGVKRVDKNQSEESSRAIQEAESKRVATSFGSSDFKLVDVKDRDATIANIKIKGRFLPIMTCTSLLDAVYNNGQASSQPLLASYCFAAADSAKYLSQHIPAHVSCINQIPRHLLVGPAAPTAHAPDLHHRYSTRMFSVARPQFVEAPPAALLQVEKLLDGEAQAQSVRALATKPLKPTGQPKNDFPGFFEVGFMTGFGITLSMVLPLVGYGTYILGRRGLEYALKMRA